MPPKIERFEASGTAVITVQDSSLPLVHFAVGLRSGAMLDPDGCSGALASLLELSLRGTEQRDRVAFATELDQLGSTLDSVVGQESAMMRGFCLQKHLHKTVDLAREALHTPALDERELQRLNDEALQEIRNGWDDDDVLADRFLRRELYENHRFARSPSGEAIDLPGIQRSDLERTQTRHLQPHELVFLFTGAIEPEEAKELVDPWLSDAGLTTAGTPVLPAPEPVEGTRIVIVDKPERTQVQMRVAQLSLDAASPYALPFWLGVLSFGGTFTAPFCHQVREIRGWSYHASAYFDRFRRYRAPVILSSAPSKTDAVDCLELELDLFSRFAAGELSSEDIQRGRAYALNRFPLQIASASDVMAPSFALELLERSPMELFRFPEVLEQISEEHVRASIQQGLKRGHVLAVLVGSAESLQKDLEKRFPEAIIDVVDHRSDRYSTTDEI